MFIQEEIQLKTLITMSTPALAKWFTVVQTEQDVRDALSFCKKQDCGYVILGQGSNTVLTQNIDQLVIANRIGGAGQITDLFASDAIQLVAQTQNTVDLKIAAGVNWHQLVEQSLQQGYSGLEQLALIPGLVGAAPIQNIGAYGVELKDVLVSVQAIEVDTGKTVELTNAECEFAYRESVFKRRPNTFFISYVTLRLNKQLQQYEVDQLYPALQAAFSGLAQEQVDSSQVFATVCEVRASKLPDPQVIPNAGSFFKNPIVSAEQKETILSRYSDLVYFPHGESDSDGEKYKLAAGWLIEKVGLKGRYQSNGIGCYEKQALVIVNPQQQSGEQVLAYAKQVTEKVQQTFGVELEIEPRVYLN